MINALAFGVLILVRSSPTILECARAIASKSDKNSLGSYHSTTGNSTAGKLKTPQG